MQATSIQANRVGTSRRKSMIRTPCEGPSICLSIDSNAEHWTRMRVPCQSGDVARVRFVACRSAWPTDTCGCQADFGRIVLAPPLPMAGMSPPSRYPTSSCSSFWYRKRLRAALAVHADTEPINNPFRWHAAVHAVVVCLGRDAAWVKLSGRHMGAACWQTPTIFAESQIPDFGAARCIRCSKDRPMPNKTMARALRMVKAWSQ